MKIQLFSTVLVFFLFSIVYLSLSVAQDYTILNLPENARGPLGRGSLNSIQFSPNGKLLAVASSTRYLDIRC